MNHGGFSVAEFIPSPVWAPYWLNIGFLLCPHWQRKVAKLRTPRNHRHGRRLLDLQEASGRPGMA